MNRLCLFLLLVLSGCSTTFVISGRSPTMRPYPWNFPKAVEWNRPLEFSWVNAVDNYRNLTAPKGKIWNPLVKDYEPDFGYEMELLRLRDIEEDEMYQ